jgi:hypothetical protein
MDLRGGRDECIQRMNGSAARLSASYQPPPFIGNGPVDPYDSGFEPPRQFPAEPFIEAPTPGAGGQALDAASQLSERHDAEEDIVFFDLGEPFEEASVGPRFRPL